MAAYGGGVPPNPPAPNLPGSYPVRPQINFDVIGEAWNLFKMQMGTWIGAMLVCGLIFFAFYMIGVFAILVPMIAMSGPRGEASGGATIVALLVQLVFFIGIVVVMMTLMGGMYRMAIKQVRGETIKIGDVFSVTDVLPQLILAAFLVGLITTLGSYMCVLPGLVAYGVLMFVLPLVVDQRMPAMAAITQSYNMLKGEWLMATLFFFVASLVGSLGMLACGFGVLFTYPVFFLAIALTYRNFMMGGSVPPGPGGPNLYPSVPTGTMPGGYVPQTPQQPPVTEGYMPSTPTTDSYMPSTPVTEGYTPPVQNTGYTPPPPPMDGTNNPTLGDNNGPTQR